MVHTHHKHVHVQANPLSLCRLSWSKKCKKKVVEIFAFLIILPDIFNLPFFTISMTILTYCSHQRRLQHRRGEEQDQLVSRVTCDRIGLFPLNANNFILPGKNVGMNKQERLSLLPSHHHNHCTASLSVLP